MRIQPLLFKNLIELPPPKAPSPMANSLAVERIKRLCHIPELAWTIPSHPRGIERQCNIEFCKTTFLNPGSTILHLTVRNHNWKSLEEKLINIHNIGVRNILVLMGDPPQPPLFQILAIENLDTIHVIRRIKSQLNQGKGFAGNPLDEPTDFRVGCAVNLTPLNMMEEQKKEPYFQMERLHKKIAAGADFVISQPPFDTKQAICFLHTYVSTYGSFNNIPFFCGVLPITSPKELKLIEEIPGISIPPIIRVRLLLAGDKYRFRQFSLEHSLEICKEMEKMPFVTGFHFSAPSGDLSFVEEVLNQRASQNKVTTLPH